MSKAFLLFLCYDILRVRLVEKMEKWRIENEKRIEKCEDRKDLVFSPMCLVGRMKKLRDGKSMKNEVDINL